MIGMAEGEDFLFRPVIKGHIRANQIFEPGLSLWHFVLMNEAIDVQTENEFRVSEALQRQAEIDRTRR